MMKARRTNANLPQPTGFFDGPAEFSNKHLVMSFTQYLINYPHLWANIPALQCEY
jgi:hypothetical protein